MIHLKNLTKTYEINKNHTVTAIEDINLEFFEGELVVLKGASGSGKSTILSLIAGLSKPTLGEVIVNDRRISKLPDDFLALFRRENIGFIFQKYNLIANLTVLENIILPLIPNNPDEKELEAKVDRLLEKLHIKDKKQIQVRHLSGGEQQRVAIARAYINDPKIIIADEPTANLDEKLSWEFIEILREFKSANKTTIIATHDPLFFELDCVDRVIEIQKGRVV
ncbi:MAG: ABC transporter ATP-binding protein [Campylobacterales bacterium]|nr:ABC transporter ATP-binding protein [Campylobacterales bacterium]